MFFHVEYWNYNPSTENHQLEKIAFNYFDSIYHKYGKVSSVNLSREDFNGFNGNHYNLRKSEQIYSLIHNKININQIYIREGIYGLGIITVNQNFSITVFNIYNKPFFIKVEHYFCNLPQNKLESENYIGNDYIFVFNSSINNLNEQNTLKFYTDSNGMEMMERVSNNSPYKSSNDINREKFTNIVYPIIKCISIRDFNNFHNKVSIFTDRPQEGGGLHKGIIFLILNRKTNYYNDNDFTKVREKMIEEGLYYNDDFKMTHLIIFGNNPFSYFNPSKTENYLNFVHN